MARVTAEERRDAITILGDGTLPPPDDVDDAFDAWRAATNESQIPGKITVWQIPMDDNGVPQPSAKNQIRLGAWPVDAYDFDGLCALLIREFMTPEKILCVRMLGTKAGSAGLQFNRVLTLRAPNVQPKENGAAPESTATLMRTIQENNERLIAQFKQMFPAPPQKDALGELERIMAFSQAMNGPMMTMLSNLLPALAGRPAAPTGADPFNMLSGLVDVFGKLQDLRGGGEGGGDGDDSITGIIRSLVPVVKPALEAIPSIVAARPMQPARPQISAPIPQTARAQPAPGSVPTQPPQPAATTAPGNITDIPSGDEAMFRELKPQIDTLVEMAGQGSDPDGAADLLFDQVIMGLPDQYYERVGDIIGGDNFVTQAAVFNPKVNAHAEWFKKFQARIVARYEQEDVAAGSAPTPTA